MRKLFSLLFFTAIILTASINAFSAWETTAGGPAGPINSLYSSGGKIYAGSLLSGVFMSLTNGDTWIDRNSKLPSTNVGTIAVIGKNVFAGTEGSGVFVSTNDGDTWKASNTGLGNFYVYSLGTDGTKLYAGTDDAGVFRSDDNGANWVSITDVNISYPVLTLQTSNGKVFIGTSFGGLFESTDQGASWQNINPKVIKFDILTIAISGSKIFVGTKDGGVYFSNDDGKSWASVNKGLKSTYVTSLFVAGSKVFAATKGGGVYFTESDGSLWYDVSAGLPETDIYSLTADNINLYAGTGSSSIVKRKLSEFSAPAVKAPVLVSPVSGTKDMDTSVTIVWNSVNGAVSYHAIISKDPAFGAGTIVSEKDGINNSFLNLTGLEKNTTYYWKAASNTVNSEKKWSEVWNFSTKIQLMPASLLLPEDNSPNVGLPYEFKWNKAGGAVSYILLVSEIETFDSLFAVNETGLTDTSFVVSILKGKQDYFWKVASVGSDDKREWSQVRKFKSDTILSVEPSVVSDGTLKLSCYPNPTSSSLNIEFESGKSLSAKLKLVDLFGAEIDLFSGAVSAETGFVSFNAGKLSNGYYRLILSSDNKTISLPVIISR